MPIRLLCALCTALLACPASAQEWRRREDQSIVTQFWLPPVDVTVSVQEVPYSHGTYTLSWTNPFPDASGRELHVFVRDSTGTIGAYTGGYEPRTSLSFHTTATKVEVFFLPRLIPYAKADAYHDWVCHFGEYKSIALSVRDTYRRQLRLRSRKDVMGLQFISKYAMVPDEMPCSGCCDIDGVLVLSRYYLSRETGKILSGRQWFNRRSVEQLVGGLHLRLIDPAARYYDKTGKQYSGAELIARKKVDIKAFSSYDFPTSEGDAPY
jgi:hypothetical protein